MTEVNLEMDVRAPATETSEPAGMLDWLLNPWIAVLVGILCYLPTLPNAFVRDDVRLIQLNPRVQSLSDLRAIWLTDWWATTLVGDDRGLDPNRDRLYRPLTLFTFALQAPLHGVTPLGFRVVNILLHAAVCGLVWSLAQRLFADRAVSTIAALLFSVHPVHAEALGEIVGRAELLNALFLLLGLIALLPKDPVRPARMVTACVCFVLALLSKETAVCYIAVAGLLLWARWRMAPQQLRPGGKLWMGVALLLPLLVYLSLRYTALEGQMVRPAVISSVVNPLKDASTWERMHGPFTLLGQYATLIVMPLRLSSDYGLATFNPAAGPGSLAVIGLVMALGLFVAAWLWLWSNIRAPAGRPAVKPIARPVGLLAAVFLASYLLISNTVLLIGTSMGERLLYWPSVPVLVALAIVIVRFWRGRGQRGELSLGNAMLGALGVVVLLGLAGRTVLRGMDWRDNLTLFRADSNTNPQSVMTLVGLASELTRLAAETQSSFEREGHLKVADAALVAALKIHAGNSAAIRQRGHVCELRGDRAAAVEMYELALQINPNDGLSRAGLTRLRAGSPDQQARLSAAIARVRQAPDDAAARLELGQILLMSGKAAEAVEHYAEAARLSPTDVSAVRGLSTALLLAGRQSEALPVLRRAIALDPQDWRSHTNLVLPLIRTDPAAALEHARKAVAIEGRDLNANLNLAEALAANGKNAESVDLLRRILDSLPAGDMNRALIEGRIRKFEGR